MEELFKQFQVIQENFLIQAGILKLADKLLDEAETVEDSSIILANVDKLFIRQKEWAEKGEQLRQKFFETIDQTPKEAFDAFVDRLLGEK